MSATTTATTASTNNKGGGKIDFDEVLKQIGPLGIYQYFQLFLLFLVTLSAGICVTVFVFTGFVPNYRCVVPQCESLNNATYYDTKVSPYISGNKTFSEYVKEAIGTNEPGKNCNITSVVTDNNNDNTMMNCQEYRDALKNPNVKKSSKICSKDQLIFDRSIVLTTVTEHYQLTCNDDIVRSIFNSLYMGGMLLGSFIIGLVSDKYGRRKALIVAILLAGGSGAIATFVNNRTLFAILRITVGMGGMGCFMVPAVIAAESTLPDYRLIATMLSGCGFAFGELVLALEAYYLRTWYSLQLVSYTPMLLLVALYFIVPESSRWLIAQGKNEEAKENLSRRASFNNAPIPIELLETPNISSNNANIQVVPNEETTTSTTQEKPHLFDLFRPKMILLRTLNMFLQWVSVTMVYYGLLFSLTTLSGNPYINFALGVSVELPSYILYWFLPRIFGRKYVLLTTQLISGVCCIIGGLLLSEPSLGWLQLILVMIGRLGASLGFGMVYIFTNELYPTPIRSTAVGVCSAIARVGGICALLMENLSNIWKPFPMIIFGSVALAAGILGFHFPETRNDKLPESIDEAMNLGQNVKRNRYGAIIIH